MAVQKLIICKECKKEKYVTYSLGYCGLDPSTCNECEKLAKAKEKSQYLLALANKPIIERLAAIEEWMYKEDRKPKYDNERILY